MRVRNNKKIPIRQLAGGDLYLHHLESNRGLLVDEPYEAIDATIILVRPRFTYHLLYKKFFGLFNNHALKWWYGQTNASQIFL